VRLDRHDLEQLGRRLSHVRAFRRVGAGWHPPLAKQAEHVIHPQAAGVAQLGTHGLGERPIACLPEPMRHERREAPVLAGGVESVGRNPERRAAGQLLLPVPCIEAGRVDADWHVGDAAKVARGIGKLEVEAPLHPGVEGHAGGRWRR
jgi:hypothetical protein